MNSEDLSAARLSLARWFMSQDISPADACMVMGSLVAHLIATGQTNPITSREHSFQVFKECLTAAFKEMADK